MKKIISLSIMFILLMGIVSPLSMTDSLEQYNIDKEELDLKVENIDKEVINIWYWKTYFNYKALIGKFNILKNKYEELTIKYEELKNSRDCSCGSSTNYIVEYVEVPIACQETCPSRSCPYGFKMNIIQKDVCGCIMEWECNEIINVGINPTHKSKDVEEPRPNPIPIPTNEPTIDQPKSR